MVDLISEEYMEYKRVRPLNRTSYSGDSRRYQFYALAGPVNTAATQKFQKQNYTITNTTYQDGLHKQIKATTKLTHLWSICLGFYFFPDLSGSNDDGVPCKFAHATRLALARQYVT